MDSQNSIYNEKRLAYYEASYKTSVIAKPQEVNLTLTAAHIYGLGYICDQIGTKEGEPVYTRFSCSLDEITKIYINENVKTSPLYIQCDESSKGITNRRRIVVPCLDNVQQIVDAINSAKDEYNQKVEKLKQLEKQRKLKDLAQNKGQIENEESNEQADDPVSQVSEFVSKHQINNIKETEPIKEVSEIKNDFDFAPVDFSSDESKENNEEQTVSADTVYAAEPEPETDDNTDFDIDDAISEILDNISAEVDLKKVVSEIDTQVFDEIEVPEDDVPEDDVPEVEVPEVEVPEVEVQEEIVIEDECKKNIFEDNASVSDEKFIVNSNPESPKKEMSLEEFEKEVKKLKTMLDTNIINEDEFVFEKKKLIANLY